MTTKKNAKNLVPGDLLSIDGGPHMVAQTFDYGNGWLMVACESGVTFDCLAYATVEVLF